MSNQATLWLFQKLLWSYPMIIGCLAIGIPMKFGVKRMTAYGQTTLWVDLVTVSWSVILAVFVKLTSKRTRKQIASYYATVWPTGFGTGGSFETLSINLVSAESVLGLPREMAEVSIVFGTVMNKSCATISVMLVTISVSRLLNFPILLVEILTLIPPVLVLGLESPDIPGGADFFVPERGRAVARAGHRWIRRDVRHHGHRINSNVLDRGQHHEQWPCRRVAE
jgi:Na+/H+-dicarboxylate symporter